MVLAYRKELEERVDDFVNDPLVPVNLARAYDADHLLDFVLGYFASNLVDYAVILSDHYKTEWSDDEMDEVTALLNRRKHEVLDAIQRSIESQNPFKEQE